MPPKRVVIEIELGIESDNILPVIGYRDGEGVNLGERTITVEEGIVQSKHQRRCFADEVFRNIQTVSQLPRLKGRQPNCGIDRLLEDLFGAVRGNLFKTLFLNPHPSTLYLKP